MRARDVMSSPAVFLSPRDPADVAAALLVAHGCTAAPVVDDDGRVVGIVTRRDVLGVVARGGAVSLTGLRRITRRDRVVD
jgi:CBS domain-containing protein